MRFWCVAISLVVFATGCGAEPPSAARSINPRKVTVADTVSADSVTLRSLAKRRGILIGNVLSDSYGWTEDPKMAELAEREFNAGILEV